MAHHEYLLTPYVVQHYGVCEWCGEPYEPGDKVYLTDTQPQGTVCEECEKENEKGLTFGYR